MSGSTGAGNSNNVGGGSVPYGPGLSPQPGFSYRNVWKPLTISFIGMYCIRGRIILLYHHTYMICFAKKYITFKEVKPKKYI